MTHDDAYTQGVWSDEKTLWVANIAESDPDDKQIIYAYDITNSNYGSRCPRNDFTVLSAAGNNRPRGIWAKWMEDEKTMYVADQTDDKIYAYHFAVVSNLALDFNTLDDAGNENPRWM